MSMLMRRAPTQMTLRAREEDYSVDLPRRRRVGSAALAVFQAATIVSIVVLGALLWSVLNQSFGPVLTQNTVDPATLAVDGVPLEEQSVEQLSAVLHANLSSGVLRRLESELPLAERSRDALYDLAVERVIEPRVIESWYLSDWVFARREIAEERARNPEAVLSFRAWLNPSFLASGQSSVPEYAGVRPAVLGSLWVVLITIAVAFPVGVAAAICLEEYASNNWLNRAIQMNINNLAGVPSIIYGMLGLAIFVRQLEPLTSGAVFGLSEPGTANGRTVLSAGLTLALLVLPLIIINSQEAIRAVPRSLRQASYGLGGTRWQTIWSHVLPSALPGILTGTILAVSRALGETAPLVVVGASTFIALDPTGPFSKFTTLPMQIYQWTARPQGAFRNIAGAASLVLLVLLLSLNASAIVLRNRYARRG